jgi:uncharacterized protein (DUF1800 family)
VIQHRYSFFDRTRVIFAAILLLSAGLPGEPLLRADSRPARSTSDPRTYAQERSRLTLDPAFKGKLPITELTEDEAILHALNRLGYGPHPKDLERIKSMGLENWIEQQLHPEKINERPLQSRLAGLRAVNLNSQTLLAQYPQPDAAAKRMGITVDEYRKQMDAQAHPPQGERPRPSKLPQEALIELQQAKALRAIYSERQLQEQLTDFWFNHFNVFANKDLDLWLLASYEGDVIRPRVLGRFRDLLGATAKSPAMLFYLDNYLSADPGAAQRLKAHPESCGAGKMRNCRR